MTCPCKVSLCVAAATVSDPALMCLGWPCAGDIAPGVEAVCERLVQRLLCAVGAADSRFASKYLVCLDRRTSGESDGLTLEYLVRLDALSTPALYPGDAPPPCRVVEGAAQEAVPQGYARLRANGHDHDPWAEFLSPGGFLRRDKVQERFVELLAAAAAPVSSPSVDESRLCGAPGKVVDAAVLADLLALPADGQLFLASGTDRYPDPRDARIAIVEGSPWVRLRLGLTRDVLVKLVLGVGVDRWPRGTDLPARVPLTHPDCLLYQHVATTGCFLVASGPPLLLRCDDRPCTWQLWAPCAEATLLRHYALELDEDPDMLHMQRWLPASAALHVVAVLDRLVCVLRGASERSYLFPSLHILSASARQGVPLSEEALMGDASALAAFLRRLHVDCSAPAVPGVPQGLGSGAGVDARTRRHSHQPAATRSRRLGFRVSSNGPAAETAHFSPRQLQYIGALLRGLLLCRALRIEGASAHSWFPGTMRRHPFATLSAASSTGTLRSSGSASSNEKKPAGEAAFAGSREAAVTADAEDVACLVAVVLEQARTYALASRADGGTGGTGFQTAARSRPGSPGRTSRASRASKGSSTSGASTMTPAVAKVYRAMLAAAGGSGSEAEADPEEDEEWEPLHGRLRNASPLSDLLLQRHRQGLHRAIGDLLPALLAMQKFSLVQEAAWSLPEPQRGEVLDGVARMARESRRRSAARSRITPTSTLRRGGKAPGEDDARDVHAEQYRVTDEHALGTPSPYREEDKDDHESLTEADRHLEQELRRMKLAESLLGTCRAARAPAHLDVELATMFDDPAGTKATAGGDLESPVHPTTLSSSFPPRGGLGGHDGHYGFLEQTHDRQLRLGPPPGHPCYPPPAVKARTAAKKSNSHKKREALTKL
ncbi:uncharacterized protein LOC117646239 [Thrips palmi]|uniref:Uncharacterized protein LOC117646239 n=1 Tax=Thrips palmi TaxID=161013 RepID=A0A6P8ZNU5_THRPL|nr:uncharacterized protein LOC117646239 [Thrips palmi]